MKFINIIGFFMVFITDEASCGKFGRCFMVFPYSSLILSSNTLASGSISSELISSFSGSKLVLAIRYGLVSVISSNKICLQIAKLRQRMPKIRSYLQH